MLFRSLQGFMTIVLLVGLFVLANWCLTSLMDGKGTMKDIYIYTCYIAYPQIELVRTQISTFLPAVNRNNEPEPAGTI